MAQPKWKVVKLENSEVWDRQNPIEGELVKVRSNVGPNGSMMYTLKTKGGEINVWGSTVLDTKFEDLPEGTMVRIKPLGLTKSEKSGREYQDFEVAYLEGSELRDPFPDDSDAPETMPDDFLEQ